MLNKQELEEEKRVNTLCNIMVNTQQLIEDLEAMEEIGLFKQRLKVAAKNMLKESLTSINQIYGEGQSEILQAIKDGRSKEEIEEMTDNHKKSSLQITKTYEELVNSRKLFDSLSFEEKFHFKEFLSKSKK